MDGQKGRRGARVVFSFVVVGLLTMGLALCRALPAEATQELHLTKGQYFTLYLQAEVERVTVGDPDVLTAKVVSPEKVRLLGLEYGVTNVLVDYIQGGTDSFAVMVSMDVRQLRSQLRRLLPRERDIRVGSNLGTIILRGEVSTRYAMETTIDIARPFANLKEASVHRIREEIDKPERLLDEPSGFDPQQTPQITGSAQVGGGRIGGGGAIPGERGLEPGQGIANRELVPDIINLMTVAETPQVLLQVQIAEISTRIMKEIGVNFTAIDRNADTAVSTFVGGLVTPGQFALPLRGRGIQAITDQTAGNPEARVLSTQRHFNIAAIIDLLRQNGLIRVLAEPNLIAMSGMEASFLAGGEFPIPVVQDVGGGGQAGGGASITIQFQEFGVRLNFVPTVIGDEQISLAVRPEVSDLNFANGVVLAGFRVPALDVRRANTSVQLRSGQTYALAGLLDHRIREDVSNIAGLGDIPILGPLFRSSSFERRETELLVLVTPRLVRPLNPEDVPVLPTADYVEPTDYDFYLWGRLEGRGPGEEEAPLALRGEPKRGGLVGAWGHYH